jgi:hypothetical protein
MFTRSGPEGRALADLYVEMQIVVKAGVRIFRHPSGPQHRYYRANFWQKILMLTAVKPVREQKN